MFFLLWLAWQALSGAFRQLSRSRTVGQKVETVTQLECETAESAGRVHMLPGTQMGSAGPHPLEVSLGTAAGLSSLVWGPPMPHIAVLFLAISLLLARAVLWALRTPS